MDTQVPRWPGIILTMWGTIYFIVDFLGNVDFVVQKYRDPAGMQNIINFLIDPPWLFQFGIFVGGLVFMRLAFSSRRQKPIAAESGRRTITEKGRIYTITPHEGRVEFYNNRQTAPSLRSLFQNAAQVWCLFQNASNIKDTDFFEWAKVKHLLLIDPDGEYATIHGKLQWSTESLRTGIIDVAKKLEGRSLPVFLYDGPSVDSMIMGDPESDNDGIIQVEVSYPYSTINQRPVFIVRRKDNQILFDNLREQYWRIANKARPYKSTSTNTPSASPLIQFAASYKFSTQEPLDPQGLSQTERRTYWVYIVNPSKEDTLRNVSVAITKLEKIERTGKKNPFDLPEVTRIPPYGLWFWEKGSNSVDLAPLQPERVKVISSTTTTNTSPFSRDIRIDVNNEEITLRASPNNTYKITLTATAENRSPKSRTFSIYVVDKGRGVYDLIMEPDDWMDNYDATKS